MLAKKVMFSERQPDYRYMPLGNGMADVFIYKFIEEIQNEEDGSPSFVYDLNEFRVNINDITEKMVRDDPMSFLEYSNVPENISIEDRVSAIEDAVMELIIGGVE